MLLFDTGKKLEKAFTKEQFDALVEVLEKRDDSLATSQELMGTKSELKADITGVRQELSEVKSELKADIAGVRQELSEVKSELKADIITVKGDMREMELRLETKIEAAKHELLKWFIGMAVAQTGVLAALYAIMR